MTPLAALQLEKAQAWWYNTLLRRALAQPGPLEDAVSGANLAFSLCPWPTAHEPELAISPAALATSHPLLPATRAAPGIVPGRSRGLRRRYIRVKAESRAHKWPRKKRRARVALAVTQPGDWKPFEGPKGGKGWEQIAATPPPRKAEEETARREAAPPAEPRPAAPSLDPRLERLRPHVTERQADNGLSVKTIWGDDLSVEDHGSAENFHKLKAANLSGSANPGDEALRLAHLDLAWQHRQEALRKVPEPPGGFEELESPVAGIGYEDWNPEDPGSGLLPEWNFVPAEQYPAEPPATPLESAAVPPAYAVNTAMPPLAPEQLAPLLPPDTEYNQHGLPPDVYRFTSSTVSEDVVEGVRMRERVPNVRAQPEIISSLRRSGWDVSAAEESGGIIASPLKRRLSVPDFAYHVVPRRVLNNVLSGGLIAGNPETSTKPISDIHGVGKVFLTGSQNDARQWMEEFAQFGEDLEVVAVDLRNADQPVYYDWASGDAEDSNPNFFMMGANIPPDRIRHIAGAGGAS